MAIPDDRRALRGRSDADIDRMLDGRWVRFVDFLVTNSNGVSYPVIE